MGHSVLYSAPCFPFTLMRRSSWQICLALHKFPGGTGNISSSLWVFSFFASYSSSQSSISTQTGRTVLWKAVACGPMQRAARALKPEGYGSSLSRDIGCIRIKLSKNPKAYFARIPRHTLQETLLLTEKPEYTDKNTYKMNWQIQPSPFSYITGKCAH